MTKEKDNIINIDNDQKNKLYSLFNNLLNYIRKAMNKNNQIKNKVYAIFKEQWEKYKPNLHEEILNYINKPFLCFNVISEDKIEGIFLFIQKK
jgi:hypothetical protein